MVPSQIRFLYTMTGTPFIFIFWRCVYLYRILSWKLWFFSPFNTLNKLSHFLGLYNFWSRFAIFQYLFSIDEVLFSLATFKIFSSFLVFSNMTVIWLSVWCLFLFYLRFSELFLIFLIDISKSSAINSLNMSSALFCFNFLKHSIIYNIIYTIHYNLYIRLYYNIRLYYIIIYYNYIYVYYTV